MFSLKSVLSDPLKVTNTQIILLVFCSQRPYDLCTNLVYSIFKIFHQYNQTVRQGYHNNCINSNSHINNNLQHHINLRYLKEGINYKLLIKVLFKKYMKIRLNKKQNLNLNKSSDLLLLLTQKYQKQKLLMQQVMLPQKQKLRNMYLRQSIQVKLLRLFDSIKLVE
ncbi:unnamed protein product [Paramecium sonneborni]|uniref:Uncharacterized protein n=1 Tax=Paramecium sonneborni TaxID=65129 RepID=A0A8S1KLU8_9CILI|nr:unnamed protein product [Paramecium sonneborni]